MTLNVMWSDSDSSYLIADSARSHGQSPRFEHSLLGQKQRRDSTVSVEEGAQKIVPLAPGVAVGLCGDEEHALALASRLRDGFRYLHPDGLQAHFQSLPESARFDVAVGICGDNPAFNVFSHPNREIFEVHRTHMHMTGSLAGEPKRFLKQALERFLLGHDPPFSSELRLVVALACAMTMSAHNDLTTHQVGGAFFGARLAEGAFFWQPDIVYIMYDPESFNGLPTVQAPDDPVDFSSVKRSEARVDQIACLVRNDVCIAVSTIGKRGVAAWSSILVENVRELERSIGSSLPESPFLGPAYFAFIPRVAGSVVVLANDGQHLRVNSERMAITEGLVGFLKSRRSNGEISLTVLQGDKNWTANCTDAP